MHVLSARSCKYWLSDDHFDRRSAGVTSNLGAVYTSKGVLKQTLNNVRPEPTLDAAHEDTFVTSAW
jgi:hypothetical protein